MAYQPSVVREPRRLQTQVVSIVYPPPPQPLPFLGDLNCNGVWAVRGENLSSQPSASALGLQIALERQQTSELV